MDFFDFIFHRWKIFDEQWQGPHEKSKKWTLFSFFLGSDFGPFGPKNTYLLLEKSKGPKNEVCKIRAKITFCENDFSGLTFCGSPQKRQKSAQIRGIGRIRRFGPFRADFEVPQKVLAWQTVCKKVTDFPILRELGFCGGVIFLTFFWFSKGPLF